jgi:hypothetical protein
MLIPKEIPHKSKIHSYYIKFEKLVDAMQEEIGSGCIYCRSIRQAHMIYFNAHELVRCVAEDQGQPPRIYHQLGDVIEAFKLRPFVISVHYLDNQAVYFWARLASRQILKTPVADVNPALLENLIAQYKAEQFSGLLDITAADDGGGLLFFQDGALAGGSYAWGRGGLSPSKSDYRRLFDLVADGRCTLEIGRFAPRED